MSVPKPYYEDTKAGIVIYLGDCRDILPHLPMERVVNKDHPEIINIFPGQQWENPFDPEATDGTFI